MVGILRFLVATVAQKALLIFELISMVFVLSVGALLD